MEPKRLELECQVCGTTMHSWSSKEQCQVCGGEMIESPFFSVGQTVQLDQTDSKAQNNRMVLILCVLIGIVAALAIISLKYAPAKKAPTDKQELKKGK